LVTAGVGTAFLKHVLEGKIGVTGRRGIRRTQLLDDVKKKRGFLKWKYRMIKKSLYT
jgi:hypothetical protein